MMVVMDSWVEMVWGHMKAGSSLEGEGAVPEQQESQQPLDNSHLTNGLLLLEEVRGPLSAAPQE